MNDENSKEVNVTDACIGCGICATIAPEVFEMNTENGKSEVRKNADLSNLEKAREAAEACPVASIKIAE